MILSELARVVFITQLREMQLHLDGCIKGEDPIHLHDLRVANRRTRAALIEFGKLLPDEISQKYKNEFRWIHRATGEVRDLDVGLSHYPGSKKKIKKKWRPHLKPLRAILEKKRSFAQQELKETLEGDRVTGILESWGKLLEEGVTDHGSLSQESAREYGCQRIVKRYRGLQKNGRKLTKNTPVEKYHDFRIQVKKLRYLMGFYKSVMDQEEFESLRNTLKAVQDAFGVFQDVEIQALTLRDLAGELADEGVGVDTLLAMGQLIGVLEKQLIRSKKICLKQARWLISEANARTFQSCFQYPVD